MTSLSHATFYILCLIICVVLLLYQEKENLNSLAKILLDLDSSSRETVRVSDIPDPDVKATRKRPGFSTLAVSRLERGRIAGASSLTATTNNNSRKYPRGYRNHHVSRGRRRRPNDKIIYFLHIHKNGGTSFCNAAKMNHLSVSWKTNCNVRRDQRCCGREDSLTAQRQFAHTTTYDLVASEKEMYDAMDTESYDYVVILRQSLSRYLSHWRHVQSGLDYSRKEAFDTWWKAQPDNYSTRMICGTQCMATPKFQLSRQDFQHTLSRLANFDSILFLESFQASYEEFANRHSWTDSNLGWKHKARENSDGNNYTSSWDPLMSALDDALYAFAQRLLRSDEDSSTPPRLEDLPLDNQQSLDHYFQEGPARNCDNPCCATKCSTYR
jgi:hypothetical protein